MHRPNCAIRTRARTLILAASLAVLLASLAQTTDHSGHAMPAADAAPPTTAFIAANDKMCSVMTIEYAGNADADFVCGMIAHHQAAEDAAPIVLEYRSDPEFRAFAEGVISAQEAEIAWMTAWQAKSGE